jgi:hypothetical protein
MVQPAGSAPLIHTEPADQGPCDLLGLEGAGAYEVQPLNTGVPSLASGGRNLWAEVMCHWLDARLSA